MRSASPDTRGKTMESPSQNGLPSPTQNDNALVVKCLRFFGTTSAKQPVLMRNKLMPLHVWPPQLERNTNGDENTT